MTKLWFACVVVVACGGKKDEGAAPKTDKPAENKPVDKLAEPAPDKPVEKPKPADAPADMSHGKCHVVTSGAVTIDQTMPHTGGSMLNVFQWHTPEMRKQIGYEAEGIILNCLGSEIKLNILSGKKPFPTKPAKYNLGGKDRGLGIMGEIKLPSGEKASIMKTNGSLEITAFDDKHIAGKGEFTIETLPKAPGEIKVAVDFDMQCYGLSGCPK